MPVRVPAKVSLAILGGFTTHPLLNLIELFLFAESLTAQSSAFSDLNVCAWRQVRRNGGPGSHFLLPWWTCCRLPLRRHFRAGSINLWLVEACLGDARAQIVGHHRRRDPAEEGEAARVRADPVGPACVQLTSAYV